MEEIALMFGWDCHVLPIEWKIEEENKKGVRIKNISVLDFEISAGSSKNGSSSKETI